MNISNEWKQELSIDDYKPFSQKVSLFDLLFEEAGGQYKPRVKSINKNCSVVGIPLTHNIIVFDSDLYSLQTNGHIKYAPTERKKFEVSGYDIAIPEFDLRSKPFLLTEQNVEDTFKREMVPFNDSDSIYSCLNKYKPKSFENGDFFYNKQIAAGYNFAPGFKIFDIEAVKNISSTDTFTESSLKGEEGLLVSNDILFSATEDASADIYLCEHDNSFKNKYLNGYDNLSPYTKIAGNVYSDVFWKAFTKYYNFQIAKPTYKNFCIIDGDNVQMDNITAYLLKHCYILLRCAFFADYVDYRDFGQKLSKSAKVIHNNLILSRNGDFERFDKNSDDGYDDTKNTRPYIPTITPSIDRLADKILNSLGKDPAKTSLEEKMQTIIDDSNDPNSEIGSLPTETFEELSESLDPSFTSSSNGESLAPLWFDPDSRNSAKDYNDIPTVMTKDGNIITDGRVISRTIDELWEAIKRIESGRMPDAEGSQSSEMGYGYGSEDYEIVTDTRPVLKHHSFISNGKQKIGDPVYIDYVNSTPLKFTVKEWVNSPNEIKYNIIDEIKDLFRYDFEIGDALLTVTSILEKIDSAVSKENVSDRPYSLRELESLLRGLQFNLAYFVSYSKQFFARVGKLGKVSNEGTYFENAGGIYQMHKDFESTGKIDTTFKGTESISPVTASRYSVKSNKEAASYATFMSAAGTWQTIQQCMNLRITSEDEEKF